MFIRNQKSKAIVSMDNVSLQKRRREIQKSRNQNTNDISIHVLHRRITDLEIQLKNALDRIHALEKGK